MRSFLIPVYVAYSAIAVGLIIWLATTLFRHGAVFLEDVFADNPRMAAAVNKLLVTGFYMANLGYAALLLKAPPANTAVTAVEVLTRKLGVLLLSLAALHFINMSIFMSLRRRHGAAYLPPPVVPQVKVAARPATKPGPFAPAS